MFCSMCRQLFSNFLAVKIEQTQIICLDQRQGNLSRSIENCSGSICGISRPRYKGHQALPTSDFDPKGIKKNTAKNLVQL